MLKTADHVVALDHTRRSSALRVAPASATTTPAAATTTTSDPPVRTSALYEIGIVSFKRLLSRSQRDSIGR